MGIFSIAFPTVREDGESYGCGIYRARAHALCLIELNKRVMTVNDAADPLSVSFKAFKLSTQVGMTWYVTTNTNINHSVVLKLARGALVETRSIPYFCIVVVVG